MDAGWLILGAAAAGLIGGGVIASAAYWPLRERERLVRDLLAAKNTESARYAAALARILKGLHDAYPEPGEPFYPHRKVAYERGVKAVNEACKEQGL